MEQEIVMTKYGTKGELQFAMNHGIDIIKHHVVSLPNRNEVEDICRELNLKAEMQAVISPRGEYSSYEHAYYILKFYKKNATTSFAIYFGEDLVSSYNDYTIEINNEEENVYEQDEPTTR